MESLAWNLKTLTGFSLASPFLFSLALALGLNWDYLWLVPAALWRRARGRAPGPRSPRAIDFPSALVVIPSLLRARDELSSMQSTVRSIAANGYPGELLVVVSIDGHDDAPPLYRELVGWAQQQRWPARMQLHVTGTPQRRGKPMAIDHAVEFVTERVQRGLLVAFPPVYVSTDADADLGPRAIELLVTRLTRRHPLTGWPARAVAGNLHLRGDAFFKGLRALFTVEGQLTLQIARHYLVANVARYNLRLCPMCGVPGALYATWSEIFLGAPRFLGFMQTLRLRHWVRWWFGAAPPSLATSDAPAMPELMAGDTDDTVSAFMAVIARWDGARFVFELPRTPLHAFWYMLRGAVVDRALRYEPAARVYTSSPSTIKSLFKQRRRWNTARIEVTGRFARCLGFHWVLGLPATYILLLIVKSWLFAAIIYFYLPLSLLGANLVTAFVIGFGCQLAVCLLLTLLSLALEGGLARTWPLLLAVPLAPLYLLAFAYVPAVVGGINDVLLFGNVTGFAPETTLIRGGSSRIALLFRLRRATTLALRAALVGDVPLGAFWLGWRETTWTPNGYEGWTSRKKPRAILPPRASWFR